MLDKLKITAEAAKGLRSRVYRSIIGGAVVMLTIGHQYLGTKLDTYIAGWHLPAGVAIPGGFAIVSAVLAYLGAKAGNDPTTTMFEGLLTKITGGQGAAPPQTPPVAGAAPATDTRPDPPTFTTQPDTAPTEPVAGSSLDQLTQQALAIYGGDTPVAGVTLVDDPDDPEGPHGANEAGETEPIGAAAV